MLKDIYEVLEQMAIEGRKFFTPLYISKKLSFNIAEKDLTEILLKYFHEVLITNFEVECPDGHSDFIVHDLDLVSTELVNCRICGMEYIPDPSRIWISFDFKPDFIELVKKKARSSGNNHVNQKIEKCNLVTV